MTTSTQPPGGPCAADWSQRRRRRGAGLPLRTPGLPPRAHCPHRGPPAEGGLDYLVLNHLGSAPAGTRARSAQATRWLLQVNFLSYVQLTSLALPSLTDSRGSLVVVSSLLGRVPTSFSSPYSAAKFALDGFFGSLRRELDVQDVNVAITMCVLGLRDRAEAAEGVRGVTRARAAPGPKAALAVIRGGATRASGVFYPWRFRLLCLLRGWLPRPRAWFIRQELNVTAAPAAA
ncbi:hydroxysteroid 11-beta-dehydrogenase 1-like protein isoform X9 [Diceros bicornis minor]|uniref:Hydroxysteroid 11-beta-dehydrogenase 1-like protein n=1 Tax=Ceratotherium simum simum TaxID=73337 RepID=A0ABM1DI93_CERSS|nr:PREDICTED: hydroxysteroid 11-beta-dehydrogenase 1-like protein isoform X2 [Ceratotherium simum simum]XP_058393910.1 hydroxysteroid 11-beta-dehydrogenase 1-like protein isoform X9 [Diceros bicornis minor]